MASLPQSLISYSRMALKLKKANTDEKLFDSIVNVPFDYKVDMAMMFLGIIVFLLLDEQTQTVNRIALSNTSQAEAAKYVSVKDFHTIKIPMNEEKNMIVAALKTKKPQYTDDWEKLFIPELTAEEARLNQASSGIAFSAVYPLFGKKRNGALIFSYYQYPEKIGKRQLSFMQKYSKLVAKDINK